MCARCENHRVREDSGTNVRNRVVQCSIARGASEEADGIYSLVNATTGRGPVLIRRPIRVPHVHNRSVLTEQPLYWAPPLRRRPVIVACRTKSSQSTVQCLGRVQGTH